MAYDPAIGDAICEQIITGKSLKDVCDGDGMPHRATVHRWLEADPDFRDRYARACELRADHIFDEIFDIADNGTNDWMERKNSEGGVVGWQENGEALRRSHLRVEARKWALSKMQPKKYGERIMAEHTGNVSVTGVQYMVVDPKSE